MWSRVIVLMLALSIMVFPCLLGAANLSSLFLFLNGLVLSTFTCLSMARRFKALSALVFVHGLFLFLVGRFYRSADWPPENQGLIIVGLLVCMLAIIPLDDQTPTDSYLEKYHGK